MMMLVDILLVVDSEGTGASLSVAILLIVVGDSEGIGSSSIELGPN